MDRLRSTDQLAGLKAFLERLESGQLRIIRVSSLDVSQDEIAVLKREIALLERILERPKDPQGQEHPADGNAVRVMRIATGEEAESSRITSLKD